MNYEAETMLEFACNDLYLDLIVSEKAGGSHVPERHWHGWKIDQIFI